jgi:hypothetical protein
MEFVLKSVELIGKKLAENDCCFTGACLGFRLERKSQPQKVAEKREDKRNHGETMKPEPLVGYNT